MQREKDTGMGEKSSRGKRKDIEFIHSGEKQLGEQSKYVLHTTGDFPERERESCYWEQGFFQHDLCWPGEQLKEDTYLFHN